MNRTPKLSTTMALVLAGSAAGACGHESEDAESAQAVVTVGTMIVAPRPFEETIGAIGSVVARAGHFASLAAPGPTRVMRVRVTTGQKVTRGEALVELDQTAFRAAAEG